MEKRLLFCFSLLRGFADNCKRSDQSVVLVCMQGIVVFASVMCSLGLQILFESGRELVMKVYKNLSAHIMLK